MLELCEVVSLIMETKSEEIGKWRKIHKDKYHNLYTPPNIVGVITLR
jgi:hypothetical protein